MPRLLVRNQVLADVAFPLHGDLVLVGRGAEAHVRIDHPSVSRLHARLERTDDGWTVEDLESRNGVLVDGIRIRRPHALVDGAVLGFGEVEAQFDAEVRATPAAADDRRPAAAGAGRDAGNSSRRRRLRAREAALIVALAVLAVPALRRLRDETRPAEPPGYARPARVDDSALSGLPDERTGAPPERAATVPAADAARAPAAPVAPGAAADAAAGSPPSAAETQPAAATAEASDARESTPPEDADAPATSAPAPTAAPATASPAPTAADPSADFDARLADAAARGGDAWPALLSAVDAEGEPERVRRTLDAWVRADPADPRPRSRRGERRWRGGWESTENLRARGLLDEAGRPVADDAARRRVRRLHFDLLGRPPTDAELDEALAEDPDATPARLVASPEHWTLWYEDELFHFLLLDEFRPAEDRLGDLPGRLARREAHVLDALGEIVKSQYFNARNPGNDTYVTVVLEQILGITVQKEPRLLEAGKLMYDGRPSQLFGRKGRSQGDFVDLVLAQPAVASVYLARKLERLLGAPPERRELERAATRLRADPFAFPEIERETVLSPAYRRQAGVLKKKSDRQFVNGLWLDLFGRTPTYPELRNLRNAVQALADPSGIRSVIIGTVLRSGAASLPEKSAVDPSRWIPEQFLRLLGRRPTQDELATFLDAWASEACRPSTVLHALLTGAEYDRY